MKIAVVKNNWKVEKFEVESVTWKDDTTINIISKGVVIPINNVLQVAIISN